MLRTGFLKYFIIGFLAVLTVAPLFGCHDFVSALFTDLTGGLLAMSLGVYPLDSSGPLSLGKIAEYHPAERAITRSAEAVIEFGRAVVKGTAAHQAKMPAAGTDLFLGVSRWSMDASDIDNESYLANDAVSIQETGIITVYVEEAVDPSSAVRVRHTDGTGGNAGKLAGSFAATADAGKTFRITSGAKYAGTTTGAGNVALQLTGTFVTAAD